MQIVAAPNRDQIRERLAKLSSMPSATRSILIEVCTLIEFGGKGRCFANNKHFATRACCSIKTVTRALDSLVKSGLVAFALENNDNARREFKMTPKLVAALSGKTEFTMDRVSHIIELKKKIKKRNYLVLL